MASTTRSADAIEGFNAEQNEAQSQTQVNSLLHSNHDESNHVPRGVKKVDPPPKPVSRKGVFARRNVPDKLLPTKLAIPQVGQPCMSRGIPWTEGPAKPCDKAFGHTYAREPPNVFRITRGRFPEGTVVFDRHLPSDPVATRWDVPDPPEDEERPHLTFTGIANFVQPADVIPIDVKKHTGEYEIATAEDYYTFDLLDAPCWRLSKSTKELQVEVDKCTKCAALDAGQYDESTLARLIESAAYDPREEYPACFQEEEEEEELAPDELPAPRRDVSISLKDVDKAQIQAWCQKLKSDLHLQTHRTIDKSFKNHFCRSDGEFQAYGRWCDEVYPRRKARPKAQQELPQPNRLESGPPVVIVSALSAQEPELRGEKLPPQITHEAEAPKTKLKIKLRNTAKPTPPDPVPSEKKLKLRLRVAKEPPSGAQQGKRKAGDDDHMVLRSSKRVRKTGPASKGGTKRKRQVEGPENNENDMVLRSSKRLRKTPAIPKPSTKRKREIDQPEGHDDDNGVPVTQPTNELPQRKRRRGVVKKTNKDVDGEAADHLAPATTGDLAGKASPLSKPSLKRKRHVAEPEDENDNAVPLPQAAKQLRRQRRPRVPSTTADQDIDSGQVGLLAPSRTEVQLGKTTHLADSNRKRKREVNQPEVEDGTDLLPPMAKRPSSEAGTVLGIAQKSTTNVFNQLEELQSEETSIAGDKVSKQPRNKQHRTLKRAETAEVEQLPEPGHNDQVNGNHQSHVVSQIIKPNEATARGGNDPGEVERFNEQHSSPSRPQMMARLENGDLIMRDEAWKHAGEKIKTQTGEWATIPDLSDRLGDP